MGVVPQDRNGTAGIQSKVLVTFDLDQLGRLGRLVAARHELEGVDFFRCCALLVHEQILPESHANVNENQPMHSHLPEFLTVGTGGDRGE